MQSATQYSLSGWNQKEHFKRQPTARLVCVIGRVGGVGFHNKSGCFVPDVQDAGVDTNLRSVRSRDGDCRSSISSV